MASAGDRVPRDVQEDVTCEYFNARKLRRVPLLDEYETFSAKAIVAALRSLRDARRCAEECLFLGATLRGVSLF